MDARNMPAETDKVLRAYRFAGFEVNLRTRRLKAPDGSALRISNGELNLLAALCAQARCALTREQLIEASHVFDNEVHDRAIDVQIMRLRRKLHIHSGQPPLIRTVKGRGYKLDVAVEVVY
jgi:two-component system, OmpR family, response regulator